MPPLASLNEIVDALDMVGEEYPQYYDRETGHVIQLMSDFVSMAEFDEPPGDNAPEWQKEAYGQAAMVAEDTAGRFVRLPSQFDIHEWQIMRRFAEARRGAAAAQLLDAIHGGGAFQRFKRAIHRLGVEQDWYAFRADALEQIAIDWCEEENIPYNDDTGGS